MSEDTQSQTPVPEEALGPIIDDAEAALAALPDPPVTEQPTGEEQKSAEPKVDENSTDRKEHKAFQEFSIDAKEPVTSGDLLTLPSNFDKETREALARAPNIELLDNQSGRAWAQDVAEGLSLSSYGETFVPTLEDPTADFRQQLTHNSTSLAAAVPRHKPVQNEIMKGERAVVRIISHLGLGTLFQVPLWHSGFWITFKPPTESEMLELHRQMVAEKIQFGRQTYGLAFSNTTSYTTDRLVSFALSHIYDMTVKAEDINIGNVRDHISCQDIPSLLWGFICTMYPRGFMYRRACTANPSACNYILEETLNVFKLQWTNGLALTDWQRTHMSARQSKIKDMASITRYKEELVKSQKTRVVLNEGKENSIALTIRTPSVSEYVDAGQRWIGDIVTTVDRALGANPNNGERNDIIVKHGQASAMRQYSHWIDNIEFAGNNVINETESIEALLDNLSSDDEIRATFTEKVVGFINSSTVSVIGIPVFRCPQCQGDNEGYFKIPAYKNVIPLDVMQVFFGLLTQRLERIASR